MLPRKLKLAVVCSVFCFLGNAASARAWEHDGKTKTFRVPVKVTVKPSDFSATIAARASRPFTHTILYAPAPLLVSPYTDPSKDRNAETDADRYQKALLEVASFEAKVKVMQKLTGAAASDRTVDGKDIKQWLEQIDKNLQVIDQRLTAVEKLLLVHDNYLRSNLPKIDEKKGPEEAPKAEPIAAPRQSEASKTPAVPTIEPVPVPVPPFDPNRLVPR